MKIVAEFLTERKKIKCELVIRLLLEKETNIETIDLNKRISLIIVVEYKKETLIRLLLKNKASIKT